MYACPTTKGIPGVTDGLDTAGPGTMGWTADDLAGWRAHLDNPGANPWESCLKGTPNVYVMPFLTVAVALSPWPTP